MARKTATYIHCDGPGCKVFFEAEKDSGMVPENWYTVHKEKDGRYFQGESWEFHTSICLAKWARLRDNALNGKSITRSSGKTVDRTGADKQLNDALEAFMMDTDSHLTVTEISELTGMDKSAAQRRVNELVMAGKVFQTEARRGPYGAKYRVNS